MPSGKRSGSASMRCVVELRIPQQSSTRMWSNPADWMPVSFIDRATDNISDAEHQSRPHWPSVHHVDQPRSGALAAVAETAPRMPSNNTGLIFSISIAWDGTD